MYKVIWDKCEIYLGEISKYNMNLEIMEHKIFIMNFWKQNKNMLA